MPSLSSLSVLREAKKVAFVFSGGSSRAAFQVGVIERLLALGIRPAMTVGVSAGAWNAAVVAAHAEQRIRFYWKSFLRMPHVDLRNLFRERSPWRFAELHRRNFARFIGDRLHADDALPCYIGVTRLRDRRGVIVDACEVERPIDLLLAANYLPPFYTHTPPVRGERFGDGGVSDNAPYEHAFAMGADAVVLVTMKGESEGGIFKSTSDVDHVVPPEYGRRMVVIRPRHRLPVRFTERDWSKLAHLMLIGDLRAREVLLGERHPQTDLRAAGEAPSLRIARFLKRVKSALRPEVPPAAAAE